MKKIKYLVQSGDSLSAIARRHNITEEVLSRMNGISELGLNSIRPGQVLQIPQESQSRQRAPTRPRTDKVRANDTLPAIAQRNDVTVEALRQANGLGGASKCPPIGVELQIPPNSGSDTAKTNQATKGAEGKSAPVQKKASEQQTSSFKEELKEGGTPSEKTVGYRIKIPPSTSSKEEFR
ncbi:LysM peptidoglycan-binding domain-containing protein, partial [Archangium violaceum]|uniref:LysM peptidoglycan-binding domain-containing protein n=1 Tax=Archangium violaceum TaxID=83451 RepID=UPI001269E945